MMKEQLVKDITEYLENKEIVIFGYLFGSYMRGRAGRLSDIDIAVFIDEKIKRDDYFTIRLDLISDLQKRSPVAVDLVILNQASPLLLHEVIKNGKLIFCKNKEELITFRFDVIRQFLDTAYMRKVQDDILYRQIEEGSFGRLEGSNKYSIEKTKQVLAKIRAA